MGHLRGSETCEEKHRVPSPTPRCIAGKRRKRRWPQPLRRNFHRRRRRSGYGSQIPRAGERCRPDMRPFLGMGKAGEVERTTDHATLLLLGYCIDVDANGGDRRDVYGEDVGHLANDPLGGSLDPKLGLSELLPLPLVPP
ncbi:hypothetical protein BHM03_00001318 [Ensete ventricosum]|nr:hypothetical protein BHM03_00001318 [Ensete ventricosum]